jgi:hypothetical protein
MVWGEDGEGGDADVLGFCMVWLENERGTACRRLNRDLCRASRIEGLDNIMVESSDKSKENAKFWEGNTNARDETGLMKS